MKVMKKLILFLVITVSVLSTNAQDTIAQGYCGANGNNLTWALTTDSVLTIGGSGAMTDYGYIGVYRPWEDYLSLITTVLINDSVKTLGQMAFSNCSNLTSVIIPDNLNTISHSVFANCYRLPSVTIGKRVILIGDYAFTNCISLGKIICKSEIPSIIYENTFRNVSKDAIVHVPCYAALRYADSDWGKVFTTFVENCVGIPQLTINNEQLKIYPNPTIEQLRIFNYELRESTTIEIYNVVGQKLLFIEFLKSPETTIDLQHLAKGMYFLKVGNKTTKFIKE